MTVSMLAFALSDIADNRPSILAFISLVSDKRYIRISSATWSLRLRAVCRRFPASPMRFVSIVSMFMCMSSASIENSILPASMSSSILCSSLTISSESSRLIIPCSPSIVACAIEPSMSCLYILPSNEIDELKSLTLESTSFLNLPDHNFINDNRFCGSGANLHNEAAKSSSFPIFDYLLSRRASSLAFSLIGRPNRLMKPAASAWL